MKTRQISGGFLGGDARGEAGSEKSY